MIQHPLLRALAFAVAFVTVLIVFSILAVYVGP